MKRYSECVVGKERRPETLYASWRQERKTDK